MRRNRRIKVDYGRTVKVSSGDDFEYVKYHVGMEVDLEESETPGDVIKDEHDFIKGVVDDLVDEGISK